MMILVGLGNPGKKYVSTRHNAGRMLAGWLRRHPAEGLEVLETDCYMNRSGEFIKQIVQKTRKTLKAGKSETSENQKARNTDSLTLRFSDLSGPPSILSFPNLIIAHDDLDLPLGSFKIQFGRGPRLHKGILSIEKALGTKDFWRVRIGIDNRKSQLLSDKISSNLITDKSAKSDSGSSDLSIIRLSAAAGRSKPTFSVSGEEYVLRPFRREEKIILNKTFNLIKQAIAEQFTKSFRSDVCNKLIK